MFFLNRAKLQEMSAFSLSSSSSASSRSSSSDESESRSKVSSCGDSFGFTNPMEKLGFSMGALLSGEAGGPSINSSESTDALSLDASQKKRLRWYRVKGKKKNNSTTGNPKVEGDDSREWGSEDVILRNLRFEARKHDEAWQQSKDALQQLLEQHPFEDSAARVRGFFRQCAELYHLPACVQWALMKAGTREQRAKAEGLEKDLNVWTAFFEGLVQAMKRRPKSEGGGGDGDGDDEHCVLARTVLTCAKADKADAAKKGKAIVPADMLAFVAIFQSHALGDFYIHQRSTEKYPPSCLTLCNELIGFFPAICSAKALLDDSAAGPEELNRYMVRVREAVQAECGPDVRVQAIKWLPKNERSEWATNWTNKTELGSGGFGVAFSAYHVHDGQFYAVKRMLLPDEKSRRSAFQEAQLLARLEHKFIVRHFHAWTEVTQDYDRKQDPNAMLDSFDLDNPGSNAGPDFTNGATWGCFKCDTRNLASAQECNKPGCKGQPPLEVLYLKMELCEGTNLKELLKAHWGVPPPQRNKRRPAVMGSPGPPSSDSTLSPRSPGSPGSGFCEGKSEDNGNGVSGNRGGAGGGIHDAAITRDDSGVWRVFSQMLHAVIYMHSHQPSIVHRDLKPENVFIDSEQNVKVGDFGLGMMVGDHQHGHKAMGQGTPKYMSPEQAGLVKSSPEQRLTPASDAYTLGLILFEMCCPIPNYKYFAKELNAELRENKLQQFCFSKEEEDGKLQGGRRYPEKYSFKALAFKILKQSCRAKDKALFQKLLGLVFHRFAAELVMKRKSAPMAGQDGESSIPDYKALAKERVGGVSPLNRTLIFALVQDAVSDRASLQWCLGQVSFATCAQVVFSEQASGLSSPLVEALAYPKSHKRHLRERVVEVMLSRFAFLLPATDLSDLSVRRSHVKPCIVIVTDAPVPLVRIILCLFMDLRPEERESVAVKVAVDKALEADQALFGSRGFGGMSRGNGGGGGGGGGGLPALEVNQFETEAPQRGTGGEGRDGKAEVESSLPPRHPTPASAASGLGGTPLTAVTQLSDILVDQHSSRHSSRHSQVSDDVPFEVRQAQEQFEQQAQEQQQRRLGLSALWFKLREVCATAGSGADQRRILVYTCSKDKEDSEEDRVDFVCV